MTAPRDAGAGLGADVDDPAVPAQLLRVPIRDPELLPPDPAFDAERGPAVAPARLSAAGLRRRFALELPWRPETTGDGALFQPQRPLRAAAVLIGLVPQAGAPGAQGEEPLRALFTVRSHQLQDHAGQISFPGGRAEAGDASLVQAALREAHEEIGLAPACVEVLGTLPAYQTVSGYRVTPVVGLVDPAATLRADPLEVAECFHVPLAFLMDGANHQRRLVEQAGLRRGVYLMDYRVPGAGRYVIWGATAAMLRNFYRFLLA